MSRCSTAACALTDENKGLIARVDGSNTSYYHFDQLGSTRLLTNGSGAVTDKYDYDAYGAVIAHEKLAGSVDQPYQYVGQLGYYTCWQEPDFVLLQLGVRFYDSALGRFSQTDQAQQGTDWYSYSLSNPTFNVDPSGLEAAPRWPEKQIIEKIGTGALNIAARCAGTALIAISLTLTLSTPLNEGEKAPSSPPNCNALRKGLGTAAKTLVDHLGHFHPGICAKSVDKLQRFRPYCFVPDLDRKSDSNYCKLIKAFRKVCVGQPYKGKPLPDPDPGACK